jgi:hypothetical protein
VCRIFNPFITTYLFKIFIYSVTILQFVFQSQCLHKSRSLSYITMINEFWLDVKTKLTSWNRTLLDKLIVAQIIKKFPVVYRNRRLITVITRARHWSLFRAGRIRFTPSFPTYLSSVSILSSHLRLRPLNCLFPSDFPAKIVYTFLISPAGLRAGRSWF